MSDYNFGFAPSAVNNVNKVEQNKVNELKTNLNTSINNDGVSTEVINSSGANEKESNPNINVVENQVKQSTVEKTNIKEGVSDISQKNSEKKMKKKNDFEKRRQSVNVIIEEIISHDIPVILTKDGYGVGGFYAQNEDGFCKIYEQEDGSLIGINYQNKPFEIYSLSDLIKANGKAYEFYKKQHKINLYDSIWFKLLMEEFSMVSSLVEKD